MELNNINGVSFILFLTLSSFLLSFSVDAICVPRNRSKEHQGPAASPGSSVPTSSPSSSTPPQSTPTPSSSGMPPSGSGESDLINIKGSFETVAKTDLMSKPFGPQLSKICDITSNPELCENSISPLLHGSATVDPVVALKGEIQQSIKEVEKAIVKVKELRKDPKTSSTTVECLDACEEVFGSAIDDLKSGLASIGTHDAGTMESMLAAVMTDLVTCDDTFAESAIDSPLDNITAKMEKYASNCLAISKLLL